MRRPLIAGNWKMNTDASTCLALARGVVAGSMGVEDRDVLVAPPFPLLPLVKRELEGSRVFLAGQNMHWEEKGAFTGEVSAQMLLSVGCTHVVLGHSERRNLFGESDEVINLKVERALIKGLVPILCVGERLEERDSGKTLEVIEAQLNGCTSCLGKGRDGIPEFIVAYEPVWAIGTGRNATPEQAQEVHAFIREYIKERFSDPVAEGLRILYGGSVTPANIDGLMAQPDVDGVLVGGASLAIDSFTRIINFQAQGQRV